jgi:hypothetical protein
MPTPFPPLVPTARRVKLGEYPTKVYRSMSGATAKRSFGNRAFSYQLTLEFKNILDATAAAIVTHYINTNAGFARFTLSTQLFDGMDSALSSQLSAPTGILWEYASPPDVESVTKGISTVRVELVGEIDP